MVRANEFRIWQGAIWWTENTSVSRWDFPPGVLCHQRPHPSPTRGIMRITRTRPAGATAECAPSCHSYTLYAQFG
jgi:hypothetical protein